jgi:hypothetical protein
MTSPPHPNDMVHSIKGVPEAQVAGTPRFLKARL